MSGRFFDVPVGSWYYTDVTEMENILNENDRPLISGIPFNSFEEGYEAIDELITINTPDSVLVVNKSLTHTQQTPVKVYIDGIYTIPSNVKTDSPEAGKTEIFLRRQVTPSSIIRVVYQGLPEVDVNNRNLPIGLTNLWEYPQVQLSTGAGYVYKYNPFSSTASEKVTYKGSQLRRLEFKSSMPTNPNFFTEEYSYTVDEDTGKVYLPFSLDNEELEFIYLQKNTITGIEEQMYVKDVAERPTGKDKVYSGFFPDVLISRAEFFTFLNGLRKHLTSKFSDTEVFTSEKAITESRFLDVRTQSSTSWWWAAIRDLEDLKLSDGSYLINGYPDHNLYYNGVITRAEIVTALDRFRVWFIDAFK